MGGRIVRIPAGEELLASLVDREVHGVGWPGAEPHGADAPVQTHQTVRLQYRPEGLPEAHRLDGAGAHRLHVGLERVHGEHGHVLDRPRHRPCDHELPEAEAVVGDGDGDLRAEVGGRRHRAEVPVLELGGGVRGRHANLESQLWEVGGGGGYVSRLNGCFPHRDYDDDSDGFLSRHESEGRRTGRAAAVRGRRRTRSEDAVGEDFDFCGGGEVGDVVGLRN